VGWLRDKSSIRGHIVKYGLEINLRFEAIQLARASVWDLWRLATALYAPLARQNRGTQVARNHTQEVQICTA
jgi:hypothetical protein